jgi:hypothetical protein
VISVVERSPFCGGVNTTFTSYRRKPGITLEPENVREQLAISLVTDTQLLNIMKEHWSHITKMALYLASTPSSGSVLRR